MVPTLDVVAETVVDEKDEIYDLAETVVDERDEVYDLAETVVDERAVVYDMAETVVDAKGENLRSGRNRCRRRREIADDPKRISSCYQYRSHSAPEVLDGKKVKLSR